MRVSVEGAGPAACAAVLALLRHGLNVRLLVAADTQVSPPIVLNRAAIEVLTDLSGSSSLCARAHQLRRRVVRWGSERPRITVEAAVCIPNSTFRKDLLDATLRKLSSADYTDLISVNVESSTPTKIGWRLSAVPHRAPDQTRVHTFGRRVLLSVDVTLKDRSHQDTFWVEGCPDGWVFLAPYGSRRAVLQGALPAPPEGDPTQALAAILASTRHIRHLVGEPEDEVRVYPIAPSIRQPVTHGAWLAIGRAAVSLDPICGDGTAQAAQTGLLAAAVVEGAEHGGNRLALLRHFKTRMRENFAAHIRACARFYDHTTFGHSWSREIAAITDGADRQPRVVRSQTKFELRDLRLVRKNNAP